MVSSIPFFSSFFRYGCYGMRDSTHNGLTDRVDAPGDTLESDSKFESGEKPMIKTDSPANR